MTPTPEKKPQDRVIYRRNPDCPCVWCRPGVPIHPPSHDPDRGHSYGYEQPHIPKSRSPWS